MIDGFCAATKRLVILLRCRRKGTLVRFPTTCAAALVALLLLGPVPVTPAHGAPRRPAPATGFDHLVPGGRPRLRERLPVNVVLVGHAPRSVDRTAFRAALADRYQPVVRSRLPYGHEEELGITYDYDYRIRFAGRSYERRLFRQLARLGKPAPLTAFQIQYNNQKRNAVTVSRNLEISAPAVERWLAAHPPRGVDTRRNTVFLLNWHGQPGFRYHVYSKTDEPDPDTGYNFGRQRPDRAVVAWGGTTARDEESGLGRTRRVWFHDLSAGPEAWAGSWNVDDADLDGDRAADYRIPPAWEYGHYRPRSALTGDLAKLTRYVALDLLATTSPLYPVELPTPVPPRTINIDSNTYEGWRGVDASRTYLRPRYALDELRELVPTKRLDLDNQDLPFTGRAERCYDLLLADRSCYPGTGYPAFANLFLQNTADLARTRDDGGRVDYELPVFNYAVDDEDVPFLGYADHNWVDGTQSYVYTAVSPAVVGEGYGLTTTLIHEVGHHLGLSHPHDGYDSATGTDVEPTGDFFFVWAGDEQNSMMSYIDLNWDFSQFDQDNMDRFQSAASIGAANRLAAAALGGSTSARVRTSLARADRAVGGSELAFARHHYKTALLLADLSYRWAQRAAQQAGVEIDALSPHGQARVDTAPPLPAPDHQPGPLVDPLDHGHRRAR